MAIPILMPRQGQSVESCVLVEWRVAPGDTVKSGMPVAAIETDKAVFEVESPGDGTVLALFFKPGDDIAVLTPIAAIGTPGENAEALRVGAAPDAAPAAVAATPSEAPAAVIASAVATSPSGDAAVSPRARHLAATKGIDATTLAGSGPQGRVIARDVQAAAAQVPHLSPAARAARDQGGLQAPATGSGPGGLVLSGDLTASRPAAPAAPAAPTTAASAGPQSIPLTGIRKLIAERMRHSLASTAQLTLTRTFDASAILDYRSQVKREGQRLGLPNITLNDMIVFAVARTLPRHPILNAHMMPDRVLRFADVHIGVATDTPRGLMVPVLRHADRFPLDQLSRELKPLLDAAQGGTINPDQLRGGTFTITNMGMLGVETFTPVLNVPEVAILGVGGLTLKPVERDGSVRHVQAITLSLTIDHQAVDGAPGARFLADLAGALESFALTASMRA